MCRAVDPSFAVSLEPLAYGLGVVSLGFFYKYYFGRCSSEIVKLIPLPYSHWRSSCYSNRLHNFSDALLQSYFDDAYVKSFFPRTARLWNSMPTESSPLTYDFHDVKSRVIDTCHLWVICNQLPKYISSFSSFICDPMPCSGCSALCGVNPN